MKNKRLLLTAESGKRIEMSGTDNSMVFYDNTGTEVFRVDDDIDTGQSGNPLGGIRCKTPAGYISYMTGNGLFSSGSGMAFSDSSAGLTTNASVVGVLNSKNSASVLSGISAGVAGVDNTQVNRGTWSNTTVYSKNDYAINGVQGYVYNNKTPSSGNAVTNTAYWTPYNNPVNSKSYAGAFIGDLMVTGNVFVDIGGTVKGFTGYELVSSQGTLTRKYINGFYIGQGDGYTW